jgi:hypothetical protein
VKITYTTTRDMTRLLEVGLTRELIGHDVGSLRPASGACSMARSAYDVGRARASCQERHAGQVLDDLGGADDRYGARRERKDGRLARYVRAE